MPVRISETIKRLLIAYVAVFVAQIIFGKMAGFNLMGTFALIPFQVLQGKVWQLITYNFIHPDFMQLLLNGLVLAFLASDIESLWGKKKFLSYYFICSASAAIFYLLIQLLWRTISGDSTHIGEPMVGASAGINGLLVAYSVLFAERQLLFMMMFPMKAKHFVWILAGIEFLQAISDQGSFSALGHLSGMGAGMMLLWFQAKGFKSLTSGMGRTAKKKSNHLRLVKTERDSDDDENPRGPRTWH